MADGHLEACALKRLQYTHVLEQQATHIELNALRLGVGKPHVVQAMAAFRQYCPESRLTHVWVATRLVKYMLSCFGVALNAFVCQLCFCSKYTGSFQQTPLSDLCLNRHTFMQLAEQHFTL